MTIATSFAALDRDYIAKLNNLVTELNTMASTLGATWVGLVYTTKSVAGGADVTATLAECAGLFIELSGAITANIKFKVPARVGIYVITNSTSGAFTITVEVVGGTGVVLRQGTTAMITTNTVRAAFPTGTLPASAAVDGANFTVGKAVSGAGGNVRCRDDAGVERWLVGMLGTGGATALSIYDLVAASERWNWNTSGHFTPGANNTVDIGSAGVAVRNIYSVNAVTVTSDGRKKTGLRDFNKQEIAAARRLAREVKLYKWAASVDADAESARWHVGMTVQRCIEIMRDEGLSAFDYGMVCYDKWADEFTDYAATDTSPERRELTRAAGDIYSFRQAELELFMRVGSEAVIMDLEARLAALEAC